MPAFAYCTAGWTAVNYLAAVMRAMRCIKWQRGHACTLQISSRKVMQQVLLQNGVPPGAFSPVCVIVDKVDKIGKEKVG